MCLPMTPAGPDNEVMKPILTGSAARTAWLAASAATMPKIIVIRNARTLASSDWGGILARQRDDIVAAAGRRTICVHGRFEPAARLEQRAEHHREVSSAHLRVGGFRVFRQPRPRLVVFPIGDQPSETMIQFLLGRTRPLFGTANELVRDAAAGHD